MPKKTIGCLAALVILAALYYFGRGGIYYYADPIRARVIDEHTGQPLEGVVVVGVWYLEHWHSSSQWHAAEGVSDKNGYFVIPAMPRRFRPWFGELQWRDPWLYFYKPGYEVAQRHNEDAYIHPVSAPGQRVRTTTTSDGHIVSDVSTYSSASKRMSYWNGKTIPLLPHEGDLKKEAESLDSMLSLSAIERLGPTKFPHLYRALISGYDQLPASARPMGMGDVREMMKERMDWQ